MSLKWSRGVVLAVAASIVTTSQANSADDGFVAITDDVRVNQYLSYTQEDPHVDSDRHGNFVVAWTSLADIYIRLYWADGTPRTDEIKVNTILDFGEQDRPQVEMTPDGDFVIVWEDWGGNDGDLMGVYARVYNSNGSSVGPEFQVNLFNGGSQFDPMAAIAPDRSFVVAWSDAGRDGIAGIYARRFFGNGAPNGGDFIVNDPATSSQVDPSVAMNRNGDFVICWTDASANYGEPRNVVGRTYDASGTPLTPEIPLNNYVIGMQRWPLVAMNIDGNFAVTWQDETGRDGGGKGVYARVFDIFGNPLRAEFQVNQVGVGDQGDPSVESDLNGNFYVAWTDSRNGDKDVYGRRFDATGSPISDEFVMSSGTAGDQSWGYFAVDESGERIIGVFQQFADVYMRLFERTPLTVATSPNAGGGEDAQFTICIPGNAGYFYVLGASLNEGTTVLPGGIHWGLSWDPLLAFSLGRAFGPLFYDFVGIMDGNSRAIGTMASPDNIGNWIPVKVSALILDLSDTNNIVIRAATRPVDATLKL